MRITHRDLVKAIGRSRRSIIIIHMEELKRQNVCRVQSATNQHDSGHIEICDAFRTYGKTKKKKRHRTGQVRRTNPAPDQNLAMCRDCVCSCGENFAAEDLTHVHEVGKIFALARTQRTGSNHLTSSCVMLNGCKDVGTLPLRLHIGIQGLLVLSQHDAR